MDPSIMKLLEDDEDDTMHSGADVDAFTAALNRDIEGDLQASSQPFESDGAVMSQGGNSTSNDLFQQWQASSRDQMTNDQSHQIREEPNVLQHQHKLLSSEMELKRHNLGAENQQQKSEIKDPTLHPNQSQNNQWQQQPPEKNQFQYSQPISLQPKQSQDDHNRPQVALSSHQFSQSTGMQISENSISVQNQGRMHNPHYLRPQQINNQPTDQASNNPPNRSKQVPFGLLLPVIAPQLDKDRAMQLQHLYNQLKRNEIPKEGFVRSMKSIVGDQMLKQAVMKMHEQLSINPSQGAAQQQNSKMQTSSSTQVTEPQQQFSKQLHQKAHNSPSEPSSYSMYGSSSGAYNPYSGSNVNASSSTLKQQNHDSQMRQVTHHQNMNMTTVPKLERQIGVNDLMRVQSGSFSNLKNNSSFVKHEPVDQAVEQQDKGHGLSSISAMKVDQGKSIAGALMEEFTEKLSGRVGIPSSMTTQVDQNASLGSRGPPTNSPIGANAKTPPKKPSIGQKKPLDGLGSSPPLPSKKQKVSGGFLDQSIDQLNDVTAVSGVDLREEEEQLFSGPKEDNRVSEASRRFVQEEEERLILQKAPLQKKLEEIMVKFGVTNMGKDVERCLSLCVEERLRGLLINLIRLSKQRVDAEKLRHKTVITSDVRHQIMMMNQTAKEEWEKKQGEAEKIRKLNDPDDISGADGDKEKDDGRGKGVKVNKEEDDKMRATAANVAARAAVGGDDMLSKWQLMAEQARQKREGTTTDGPSSSQPSKDISKPSSSSGKSVKENQEHDKRGQSSEIVASGTIKRVGQNQVTVPQTKVARNISVKDMIAVLEREPQMSKSTLIYRMYDKMRTEPSID